MSDDYTARAALLEFILALCKNIFLLEFTILKIIQNYSKCAQLGVVHFMKTMKFIVILLIGLHINLMQASEYKNSWSPLHEAALQGSVKKIQNLITKGVDIHAINLYEQNFLHVFAVMHTHRYFELNTLTLLSDIKSSKDAFGRTPDELVYGSVVADVKNVQRKQFREKITLNLCKKKKLTLHKEKLILNEL